MVLAHLAAETTNLWLTWNFDPQLVIGIALLVAVYFYALGPLRRRFALADHVETRHVAFFVSSIVVLVFSLNSPLDALGDDYLFSAHMIQHMLIAVVFPPLFLLGIPDWMVEPLFRRPALRWLAKWVSHPVVAFTLFNADMWIWHVPALYDATLANENIHIFEHLTFIVLGVVFWLPVLGPSRIFTRITGPVAVLYMFIAMPPMAALGALLTFATTPFYAPYVTAPRIWGLSPLMDQQLGGLIMWVPTNLPYIVAMSILFIRWVGEVEQKERAAAGEYTDDMVYIIAPQTSAATTSTVAAATTAPTTDAPDAPRVEEGGLTP